MFLFENLFFIKYQLIFLKLNLCCSPRIKI